MYYDLTLWSLGWKLALEMVLGNNTYVHVKGPPLQMLPIIQQIVTLGLERFNERVQLKSKSHLEFKVFLPSKAKQS